MMVGWTGHRPEVFQDAAWARREVERAAEMAADAWPTAEFICGGQRGVDRWAAAAALARGISLHLVLPTPVSRFASGWPERDRRQLEGQLSRAGSVEVADEEGHQGPLAYDRRNEAIVRRSDLIIGVWTGIRRGGTFHTLCAAWARGVPVREIRLSAAPHLHPGGRGL